MSPKDEASSARSKAKATNVLIVGVGGQGVIMVSKVLATICQMEGHKVKQSEVHGMAKRGGSVFSHVRFGEQIWSPTIPRGKADVLLAMEWAEGMRWLNCLDKETGTLIADTQHIVPPFACQNRRRGAERVYSRETPAEIINMVSAGYAVDATQTATELGNPRAANTVLLGTLSAILDFPEELWLDVISKSVPPKTVDVNLKAFQWGRDWVARVRENPEIDDFVPSGETPVLPTALDDEFELRITPEWCKGCDICVKMCPERCLALNADQVVELIDEEACTGCRVCEILCPDFAIDVLRDTAA